MPSLIPPEVHSGRHGLQSSHRVSADPQLSTDDRVESGFFLWFLSLFDGCRGGGLVVWRSPKGPCSSQGACGRRMDETKRRTAALAPPPRPPPARHCSSTAANETDRAGQSEEQEAGRHTQVGFAQAVCCVYKQRFHKLVAWLSPRILSRPSLWSTPANRNFTVSQCQARSSAEHFVSQPCQAPLRGSPISIPAHCDITAEAQPWNLECKGARPLD